MAQTQQNETCRIGKEVIFSLAIQQWEGISCMQFEKRSVHLTSDPQDSSVSGVQLQNAERLVLCPLLQALAVDLHQASKNTRRRETESPLCV